MARSDQFEDRPNQLHYWNASSEHSFWWWWWKIMFLEEKKSFHWKEFGQGFHLTLCKMKNLLWFFPLPDRDRQRDLHSLSSPLTLSIDHFALHLNFDKEPQTPPVWGGFQNWDFLLLASLWTRWLWPRQIHHLIFDAKRWKAYSGSALFVGKFWFWVWA